MSEGHREALVWLFRDARGRDESNSTNYAWPVTCDLAPVTYGICSFVHPQQNCEKLIRAIFFVPRRAGKSGATRMRDLTRSVPRGTV